MSRSISFILCAVLLAATASLMAQPSNVLLPGTERLLSYDVDTTGRWWAITEPAFGLQRIVIDGESYGVFDSVEAPILAPNGESVAIIGYRGINCILQRDHDTMHVGQARVRLVVFAGMTSRLFWSTSDVGAHTVTNGKDLWTLTDPPSVLAPDPNGFGAAWVIPHRGTGMQTLFVDGIDVVTAEQILLVGRLTDGRVVYAFSKGLLDVHVQDEIIASGLLAIEYTVMDRAGTRIAWIQQRTDRDREVCIWDDSMSEPWVSKRLTAATDLVLSNEHALVAFRGTRLDQRFVFFNTAEYPCGYQCGPPSFASDGATMVYASQEDDNAIVINGKRTRVSAGVPMQDPVASVLDGSVVAWSSKTTLIRVVPELNITSLGAMCEAMSRTVYDRRNDRFMALGQVGERLLLLTAPAH